MHNSKNAHPGTAHLMLFRSLVLVCATVLLTTATYAQGIYSVNTNPSPATALSPTTIQVTGWMPNPCWSYATPAVLWSGGNTVNIYFDFTVTPQPACPAIIVSFDQNIPLGTLSSGNYVAKIWNKDANQVMETYNFTVTSGQSSNSCGNPVLLECGSSYLGNTATTGNTVFSSYTVGTTTSTNLTGPEVIHKFTLTQPSVVTVTMSNLSQDLEMFILSQCSNVLGLYKSENSGTTVETITATLNAGTYYLVVDGYAGAVSNYLLAISCNASGSGSACGTPTGLQASALTWYSAFISWTAVSGAQSYTVEYRPANGVWATLPNLYVTYTLLGNNNPGVINHTLASGAAYEYRVRANCSNGQVSAWASATFTTLNGTCASPTANQLTVSSVTNTSATVTCLASAPTFKYRYRIAGSNNAWSYQTSGYNSNTRTYNNLQACTTYEVQCQIGCSPSGWSGFSTSKYFTTSGCSTPCNAPSVTQLYPSNITTTSVTFNCTANGTAWDWAYRVVGSSSYIDLQGTTVNYITVNGLTPGTPYEIICSVRCNATTWSPWSSPQTFSTNSNSTQTNDEPCGATTIIPGNDCTYQTISLTGATLTTAPPAPFFSDCPTAEMHDRWIKVPVPSTGKFGVYTTPGTNNNIVVAFYAGSSCTSTTAFGCGDDNPNGDKMPDFIVTSSAQYVWIRVWSYNGALGGTFNICVQTLYGISGNGNDNDSISVLDTDVSDRGAVVAAQAGGIQIFPVPARDEININMPFADQSPTVITIFDINGKKVKVMEADPAEPAILYISDLPAGNYVVRVQSEKTVHTGQFIKVD